MPEIRTSLGLMSGTSMDGIDIALLKTDGVDFVERGPNGFYPYTPSTRKNIHKALNDALEVKERADRPGILKSVEDEITALHGGAVKHFLHTNDLSLNEIDVVGFHGQTVSHRPDVGLTVQLGDGEKLAESIEIPVVYDMRANDMVHGGQGAPLVPVYHKALARNLPAEFSTDDPVVFVNIGGISNVTYVGDELIAFDCGPGNALIDQWVQKTVGISFDQGGMIANEGDVDQELVERYLADPFFRKPVPKSLDRNDFRLPDEDRAGIETVARSLARVTAEAIFRSSEHFSEKPKLWIVCGGGRHNPHIMRDLEQVAGKQNSKVLSADELGFNGDSMEAEAWGYLAVRSVSGLPLTFPKTTGCLEPITGGKFAEVQD